MEVLRGDFVDVGSKYYIFSVLILQYIIKILNNYDVFFSNCNFYFKVFGVKICVFIIFFNFKDGFVFVIFII